MFLAASLSRYPLEGYRESCATKTVLGTRHANKPIELDIPITIAGMSFGALSANVKEALGRAATAMGTSTTTGDGGMTAEERDSSKTLVYQCLPSRYGFNPDDLRKADAIEVVIGQGAKPGGGGMLLGQKINPRVAAMRTLPEGIDQRSACRHPDWTGPDDLTIKIHELREITDWEKPIYVKVGATRVFNDVKLAVHAGADVIVVDGMQGGTAATQSVFIEHVGIPTLAAVRQAVEALEDLNMKEHGATDRFRRHPHGRRCGQSAGAGRRCGGDRSRHVDGARLQPRRLLAERPTRVERVGGLRSARHVRRASAITATPGTARSASRRRTRCSSSASQPEWGARHLKNYLKTLTMELTTIARACGKQDVHHLEREDLVALTVEAAAMARVPLAGTNWIPGSSI